ncbi:MAG: SpoVA/SpoVAEb family sporulation membrane protein [Oscillospiraceae bacterium]|jgi:stage V sporulation protein AC|nr:SpoVA/SpoVAEb family sporulation membrane protein [Oscillospiraceae bacterium]
MKMTNREYGAYVNRLSPPSRLSRNLPRAFLSGGLICCVGQAILILLRGTGQREEVVLAGTSILMVFLGAALTGLHVYDTLAKFAGAGSLVPITGFANSVTAPALEFRSEGVVTGMAAKMFVIAGPVLVFGISASVIFGIVYCLVR